MQTRTSYTPDELICGARFANAFMDSAAQKFAESKGTDKKIAVDMRLFDKVEKIGEALNR